jgi:hypothetical protein
MVWKGMQLVGHVTNEGKAELVIDSEEKKVDCMDSRVD